MTNQVYIQGKVHWVHAVNTNKFGDWSFQIYPDTKSLEIIRDLQSKGLKNVLKKDDDGYYIQFKRPVKIKVKGKDQPLNKPTIVDREGKPIDGVAIGNGSDATAKLSVYSHPTPSGGRAVAARWESMRIDNLVEFNRDTDFPKDVRGQVDGLEQQPEQLF